MSEQLDDVAEPNGHAAAMAFAAPVERDGVTVITATTARVRTVGIGGRPGPRAEVSGSHPLGAFAINDGRVRWHPTVDATRLLMAAELVVGAVLVANRLARRPSAAKAHVTMGAGGWVSMKGGTVAVRPGSRPWGRRRPVPLTAVRTRRPLWARLLAAVPLQNLVG